MYFHPQIKWEIIESRRTNKELDTLITQIITNTGEELLRLAKGDKHAKHLGWIEFDTLKKHITSVTGVE